MKKEWLFFCVGLYPGLFRAVSAQQSCTYASYPSIENKRNSRTVSMPVFTIALITTQLPAGIVEVLLSRKTTDLFLFVTIRNHFKKNIRG